jgi:cytochrome c2
MSITPRSLLKYVFAFIIAAVVTVSTSSLTTLISNRITGNLETSASGAHPTGARVFRTYCSSCHTLSKSGSKRIGPSLHEIGKVAATRKQGLSASEYLLESIIDPGAYKAPGAAGGMPSQIWTRFTDDELIELVAFLSSQGGSVTQTDLDSLKVPERADDPNETAAVSLAELKAGELIFRNKAGCVACHKLRAHSGYTLRAPSLLDVGALSETELRRSIEFPSDQIVEGYQQVLVKKTDGSTELGIFTGRDEQGVQLLQTDLLNVQSLHISYAEISGGQQADFEIVPTSTMPSYLGVLSAKEMEQLIAFLRDRKGAIPSHGRTGMFKYR